MKRRRAAWPLTPITETRAGALLPNDRNSLAARLAGSSRTTAAGKHGRGSLATGEYNAPFTGGTPPATASGTPQFVQGGSLVAPSGRPGRSDAGVDTAAQSIRNSCIGDDDCR